MLLIIIINSVFSRNYLSFILAKRWNIVYKIRLRSHKKHWSKIHFVFKCFPEKFIQCVHMLICAVKHNFHTSPSVGIGQQITTTRACSQKWLLSKSFISIITKLAGLPTDCLVNCFNQAVSGSNFLDMSWLGQTTNAHLCNQIKLMFDFCLRYPVFSYYRQRTILRQIWIIF